MYTRDTRTFPVGKKLRITERREERERETLRLTLRQRDRDKLIIFSTLLANKAGGHSG